MSDADDPEYDVGYARPPRQHQFKPGQSGNPRGRPKGAKNLATDLSEELREKVLVTEAGRQRKTTKQRAMLKTLFAKALGGDTRAATVILGLIERADGSAPDEAATALELAPEDQAVLASFKARLLSEADRADDEPRDQGDAP